MSGIIQISEAASLALHGMVFISKNDSTSLSVKDIANATGASENHLSKVMQRLSKAGLVGSTRGPKGGFHLSKPADEISFYDIYTAIEGEFKSDGCPLSRPKCPMKQCIFCGLLQKTTDEYREFFKKTKLSDFIDK